MELCENGSSLGWRVSPGCCQGQSWWWWAEPGVVVHLLHLHLLLLLLHHLRLHFVACLPFSSKLNFLLNNRDWVQIFLGDFKSCFDIIPYHFFFLSLPCVSSIFTFSSAGRVSRLKQFWARPNNWWAGQQSHQITRLPSSSSCCSSDQASLVDISKGRPTPGQEWCKKSNQFISYPSPTPP